ncbi:MAG: hypothetical protein R3E13_09145 [Alphaproteobacteria bacterium]
MNDTPSTAPSINPEDVIKGFEDASETILLLSDTLKLFLATEKGGVKNPYEEISHEEAMALCGNPAPLPGHLKNFILWQSNILQRDVLEISETEMPKSFHCKYDVKGSWLADMESDDLRKAAMQTYLEEEEAYFTVFNEACALLEAAEERLASVERVLLQAKSLGGGVTARVQAEHKMLEETRGKLGDIRAAMEGRILPDPATFQDVPELVQEALIRLGEIHITAHDAVRLHVLGRDTAEGAV